MAQIHPVTLSASVERAIKRIVAPGLVLRYPRWNFASVQAGGFESQQLARQLPIDLPSNQGFLVRGVMFHLGGETMAAQPDTANEEIDKYIALTTRAPENVPPATTVSSGNDARAFVRNDEPGVIASEFTRSYASSNSTDFTGLGTEQYADSLLPAIIVQSFLTLAFAIDGAPAATSMEGAGAVKGDVVELEQAAFLGALSNQGLIFG